VAQRGNAKSNRQLDEPAAVWVPPGELSPWKDNPRDNATAVASVKESIRRFGFGSPIVARQADGQVIAGHTRLLAARQLGLTHVPVRFLDLDAADARLLALADNKLGELVGWDEAALAQVLEDLKTEGADLAASGFDPSEIDRLLAELAAGRLEDVEEDPVPEPPAAPDSVPGAIYELGPHRLFCGDSTRPDAVTEALGGATADLLWTDAPYGVSYQSHMAEGGTAARFPPIENDDLTPEALQGFLAACFHNAAAGMRPGAAFYACHANQRPGIYPAFEGALLASGFHIASVLVWVKPAATMGWQDYRNRYEPILYGWKPGVERRKVEDRTETTVWEVARDAAASYEHPTQKPVELVARALRNSTVAGEVVLDIFGGSGSALIAAARLGRKAVLIEKDPGYCDVIRQRWARFEAKLRG
jgi:DNA modification methylase